MIEKIYNPKLIESKWNDCWSKCECFKVIDLEKINAKHCFCIMLPPPNITGNLHMGHAFQHTMMDVLIRFNKMQGKEVLWQAGLDHAGISTQMTVERQLNSKGIKRSDLTREQFVEKVWLWNNTVM